VTFFDPSLESPYDECLAFELRARGILNFNVPLLKDGIARVVNDGHGPILPV